jgi:hypothetical protein
MDNSTPEEHPLVTALPDDWDQHHFLITHGKVKKLSKSAAYIIDMLTKDK